MTTDICRPTPVPVTKATGMLFVLDGFRGEWETHEVLLIEYHDGHPFSAITLQHDENLFLGAWDFDWCRRDKTAYYNGSGDCSNPIRLNTYLGGNGSIWVAPGVAVIGTGRRWKKPRQLTSAAHFASCGFRLLRQPKLLRMPDGTRTRNPFEAGSGDTCSFCDKCRDWLPDENPCKHFR